MPEMSEKGQRHGLWNKPYFIKSGNSLLISDTASFKLYPSAYAGSEMF